MLERGGNRDGTEAVCTYVLTGHVWVLVIVT